MWGDPERALKLNSADPLAAVLLQVTGPAHVPSQDPRWQELLLGYDVWVHVELVWDDEHHLINKATQSLIQYAPRTSNLAALALHAARMLHELAETTSDGIITQRIALVGKARATAGVLVLLRLLIHAVIVHDAKSETDEDYLAQVFLYQSRGSLHVQESAHELWQAVLEYLAQSDLPLQVPEIYDVTVHTLQLALVLSSSQLYQPLQSSFQRASSASDIPYLWGKLRAVTMSQLAAYSPAGIVYVIFTRILERPPAPPRSIAAHHAQLARSVAQAKGEKVGPDGLYESSHLVVNACAHKEPTNVSPTYLTSTATTRTTSYTTTLSKSSVLLDATKGVLVLSSTIIMLPFRLVSLALGLWGHNKEKQYDQAHRQHLQSHFQSSRTKDVLWITESPVADMSTTLLLLWANSERAEANPFRTALESLSDNRWTMMQGILPDLPSLNGNDSKQQESTPLMALTSPIDSGESHHNGSTMITNLTVNYEELFENFGRTAHNEVGALLLYTLLQSSPSFAEALAVRSDLDTIVLPLLRTLYFASSLRYYAAQDFASRGKTYERDIRNCPFRSQSQLYVIVIVLLIFSQDNSFGPDAFRRIIIQHIPWYKERNLRDVSLGSVLILTLLRMLTFLLNRFPDAFVLSNCCAILMNLSPSVVELHDYAAMRLVSVTTHVMKKYGTLHAEQPNADPDDLTLPVSMHGEVARTLLRVLKHCVGGKNVEKNTHLVYALVYHQTEWKRIVSAHSKLFTKSEISRIQKVMEKASDLIDQHSTARTASQALQVLQAHQSDLILPDRQRDDDTYAFTYEEESDPEIFFVPYVWEVIVSVVTSSSLEWNTSRIRVFPLLSIEAPIAMAENNNGDGSPATFSEDVTDVV